MVVRIARSRLLSTIGVLIVLPFSLAACAINDTGKPTAPPITLNAPPITLIEGNCDVTGELEAWLQVTTRTRQDFQERLDAAAAKNAVDVYDDTIYLLALRDTVANTTTPDCGVTVQEVLTSAMSGAVAALQGYYNGTLPSDVATALIEPQKGLDQAAVLQNELITRMRNQYQLENNLTPTPTTTS